MKIGEEVIVEGLKKIFYKPFSDFRGTITKVYRAELFEDIGNIKEMYVTHSEHKYTVRGLHYQKGQYGQDKMIYCITGRLLDVCVCLKKDSPYFGEVFLQELSSQSEHALFIPKYFAHGILTLEGNTSYINMSPDAYKAGFESGIDMFDVIPKEKDIEYLISHKDMKWNSLRTELELQTKRRGVE